MNMQYRFTRVPKLTYFDKFGYAGRKFVMNVSVFVKLIFYAMITLLIEQFYM
jgi:hypothetical protein